MRDEEDCGGVAEAKAVWYFCLKMNVTDKILADYNCLTH